MRPAAMDGALSPPPRPFAAQASGGPSFGHSFSRPVSLETELRCGPCHWGQSLAWATRADEKATAAAATAVASEARQETFLLMKCSSCLGLPEWLPAARESAG